MKMTIGGGNQTADTTRLNEVDPHLQLKYPSTTSPQLPEWTKEQRGTWGERLFVPEWEEESGYRVSHGWKGRDLVHASTSPVRVLEYMVDYGNDGGGVGTILTGIVHFTHYAESHKGFCHGGSMCSVMDDVIGWCGFLTSGKCMPWSGFTVQINTSLKKPIAVNSVLKIRAQIVKVDGKKVYIEAVLTDPIGLDGKDEVIHARGDGLVILTKEALAST
mmetsp:Transcript_11354/g.10867  ORF Transcript_11354/g.10867 Transcript_11354/m.10867 type:complete len:218 (-) Transcript_11354:18-671(-)